MTQISFTSLLTSPQAPGVPGCQKIQTPYFSDIRPLLEKSRNLNILRSLINGQAQINEKGWQKFSFSRGFMKFFLSLGISLTNNQSVEEMSTYDYRKSLSFLLASLTHKSDLLKTEYDVHCITQYYAQQGIFWKPGKTSKFRPIHSTK